MGLRHNIWREELYQKLKDYPGPIKASEIRKKLGCGMDINYAMKEIMKIHKDVIKFGYGRDVYYRVIPFGKKDEEKPLTPSEQKKKEWEGQNRLYEIAKSYNLVNLDRFRIGKEKLNELQS